jgi:(p)ppGpp synthase/HD superfamily hydrolase
VAQFETNLFLKALSFAAYKHRHQSRKGSKPIPYINHPIALADLPKEERKRLQVEHAPSLSHRARTVKLADKTCNLRDVVEDPPADWSVERKQQYFDWAKSVVDQIRGTNVKLENEFDEAFAKRPQS